MSAQRNRKGQFMCSTPNPLAKSANPADGTRALRIGHQDVAPATRMTHAVVVDLGSERTVLSLHPNVEAARFEAKASMFCDARVVSV